MSEETPSAPLKKRPTGLGRGLSALLGEIEREAPVALDGNTPDGVRMVDVNRLRPLPNQPRKTFKDDALDELAESIKSRGMLQPIVVRDPDHDGHYEIIAGERRWRAAQRAQLHQVPVIVREFDDVTALEIAIIENIQREQLNAWEEGEAYRRLIDDHGHTQEALGRIVGKSRSHVANLMRLRNLPLPVHDWLTAGEITMGHARALLGAEDPLSLGRMIVQRGLSVRETERLVKKAKAPTRTRNARSGDRVGDPDLLALERQLTDMLGLKVKINHQARSGTMTLSYSSLEQLDMICQRLSGEPI
ncbi:ParB/RepB/Spo0J family partition protein [Aquisediminimonas profunda]|uniref:ParB/RepB/Spo0J family partition protein n=1 Tax=Aquisediminimonas profunda TaxID=1550733 RepID=UPI001FEA9E3C|nr:ParB/RepB/Spo0J family partition protein [Aquisediminimonas profunda]